MGRWTWSWNRFFSAMLAVLSLALLLLASFLAINILRCCLADPDPTDPVVVPDSVPPGPVVVSDTAPPDPVVVPDSVRTDTNEPPPSVAQIDADWILVTYHAQDGKDLDIGVRILVDGVPAGLDPVGGEFGHALGWHSGDSRDGDRVHGKVLRQGGDAVASWGGDNVATGFEAVLINLAAIHQAFPAARVLDVDCRAFWFESVGARPIQVKATLYQGGVPVPAVGEHTWRVQGATQEREIATVEMPVRVWSKDPEQAVPVARLTYEFATSEARLTATAAAP